MGELGEDWDVQHSVGRIGDSFDVDGFGCLVNLSSKVIRIVARDELREILLASVIA